MKKYIIGAFVGACLMFSLQVAADSWVGKEVQGTFPIYVNGKELDVPAVVIDGKSFLPVRKISESVNYDVNFDNTKKVVNLNNLNDGLSLDDLDKKMKSSDKLIKWRKGNIELWMLEIEKGNLSDEAKQTRLQKIEEEQGKITSMESIRSGVLQAISEKQAQ